jgi:hypothetical protein
LACHAREGADHSGSSGPGDTPAPARGAGTPRSAELVSTEPVPGYDSDFVPTRMYNQRVRHRSAQKKRLDVQEIERLEHDRVKEAARLAAEQTAQALEQERQATERAQKLEALKRELAEAEATRIRAAAEVATLEAGGELPAAAPPPPGGGAGGLPPAGGAPPEPGDDSSEGESYVEEENADEDSEEEDEEDLELEVGVKRTSPRHSKRTSTGSKGGQNKKRAKR